MRRRSAVLSILALSFLALPAAAPQRVSGAEPPPPDRARVPVGSRPIPWVSGDRELSALTVPDGKVGVKSAFAWKYPDGTLYVVGEVLNRTTSRRRTPNLIVTYYGPGGAVLGSASEFAIGQSVASGAVAPFSIGNGYPPTGIASFKVVVDTTNVTTIVPAGSLDVVMGTSYVDGDYRVYPGSVVNPNAFPVENTWLTLTAYDDGDVIDVVKHDYFPDDLPATSSTEFLFGLPLDYGPVAVDAFRIRVEGDRPSDNRYVTTWANYFNDIGASSFRDDIVWLAEAGVTKGCGTAKYCPGSDVRRDEMASFLARALGLGGSAPNAFTDDDGNAHEREIDLIAKAGITSGCAQTRYCPSTSVKRDQMASFLVRSLHLSGPAPDAFADDAGNSHEHDIDLLAQAGVTSGCGPTAFCPSSDVTRGQMAAFLRRAFEHPAP